MHVVDPKGVSMCRSKGRGDVWIERTYDSVVASGCLKESSYQWKWLKSLCQDHIRQFLLW